MNRNDPRASADSFGAAGTSAVSRILPMAALR